MHQSPIRITFVATLALAAACTTSDARPDDVRTFSTTSYAPQNRPDVRGTTGAVSAGHPLAAQAGLTVLKDGGTATDAIIAMAAVLAVVRPHMNGIGGDAFGIFYDGETGEVTALNASGRSGALATPEFFAAGGMERIAGIAADRGDCPAVGDGERFGPPVARPYKFIAIGQNYRKHVEQVGGPMPQRPTRFTTRTPFTSGSTRDVMAPRPPTHLHSTVS